MELNLICRFCLNQNEPLTTLSKDAEEILQTCLGLEPKPMNDSKICLICSNFLEKVCNFKLMCLESENQLFQLPKIEIITPELPPPAPLPGPALDPTKPHRTKSQIAKSIRSKMIVQCTICGKQLQNNSMKYHMRVHAKRFYECHHCGKIINQKPSLRAHIQNIHFKIRNFFCDLCPEHEGFVDKNALRAHNKLHHGVKFVCTYCGVEKKTKHTLQTHIESVHTKTQKFPCPHCPVRYNSDSAIKYHIKSSHTLSDKVTNFGKLNVVCVCGMEFTTRVTWRQHLKDEHQDSEGRWKCPIKECNRDYVDRDKLVNHFRKHHDMEYEYTVRYQATKTDDGRYVCDICEETFGELIKLSNHRIKVHREIYGYGNEDASEVLPLLKKVTRKGFVCVRKPAQRKNQKNINENKD